MTRYDTITVEFDDVTYELHYSYAPPRPATYWEPPSGGLAVETVTAILRGGVRLPVLDYERLADLPELIEQAERNEREKRECA